MSKLNSCTNRSLSGIGISTLAVGATFVFTSNGWAMSSNCCDCLADINKDGTVAGDDLGLLLAAWSTPGSAENGFCEDVNGDGAVDGADLGLLLAAWQSCVPNDADRCRGDCPASDHDCCTKGGPGCADAACCDMVCKVDIFCCRTAWDELCVGEAQTICGVDCQVCPNPAHGCFTTGGPGCSNTACCNAVCAVDAFCCAFEWDGSCVDDARTLCGPPDCTFVCTGIDEGEPCGDDINDGCDQPIQGDSDCCTAGGGLGCDDAACEAAVCAVDGFCCGAAWDGICAIEAASLCPDLCQLDQLGIIFIGCGETVCASAWAEGGSTDRDWYAFENVSGGPQEIVLTMQCQLPMFFGKIDWAPCGGVTGMFTSTGLCDDSVSFTICADIGVTWLFAKPLGSSSNFPCGSGKNQYSLTVECTGLVCDPVINPACGPDSDHDCCTTGSLGCNDEECCNFVCAIDEFCCYVAWDSLCIDEAADVCGCCRPGECDASCGEAAVHDCFTAGGPGCTDEACCSAVCARDSFCCSAAWDGGCVEEALTLCGPRQPCPLICAGTDEGESCGDDANGGCDVGPVGDSNCCVANRGIGCDDAVCQAVVCTIDSFCCQVAWDGICASEAATMCPTLCAPNDPVLGSISCGETLCCTAWADGGFRDTDWFVMENPFDHPIEIVVNVTSELPMTVGKIDATDCRDVTGMDPSATTGLCGSASLTCCADVGTTWLFAAPSVFAGFPCGGDDVNGYSISVTCTGEACKE